MMEFITYSLCWLGTIFIVALIVVAFVIIGSGPED